jgi:hypothetical protein
MDQIRGNGVATLDALGRPHRKQLRMTLLASFFEGPIYLLFSVRAEMSNLARPDLLTGRSI